MKIILKIFGTDYFKTNFCVRDDVQHARRIQSLKANLNPDEGVFPHSSALDAEWTIGKNLSDDGNWIADEIRIR
jgi:hypothetical protein